MRRLATILALLVVGYPLLIAATTPILVVGVMALALCSLGIVFSTPMLVAGAVLALAEYTLALWISGGPPRLGGAVLLGVGLVLLLETADFGRRIRRATLGPGLVLSQVRSWAVFGALAGTAAIGVIGIATVASAATRLPWAPAFAAGGAALALVAVAIALRRPR